MTSGNIELPATWTTYSEPNAFVSLIGPVWENLHDSHYECALNVTDKHCNRLGNMHGGAISAFADQALGRAAWLANENMPVVTVELTISFIDACRMGERITCKVQTLRRTKTLLFLRGDLFAGDRLISTAGGIWKAVREGSGVKNGQP